MVERGKARYGLAIVTVFDKPDHHTQYICCMCGCGAPMVEVAEVEDQVDWVRFLRTGIYSQGART